jgi:hypothetical protein
MKRMRAGAQVKYAALLIRISPKQQCLGIEVLDYTFDGEDPAPYFAKVTSALELIAQLQPMRLGRIRRDLKRIVIAKQVGASYWPNWRACALTPRGLDSEDIAGIALSIIHEATHARLDGCGIEYIADLRPRIERRCTEEEISFALLLEDGQKRAAELTSKLEKPWWTDEQLRSYQIRKLEMNYPAWVARRMIARLPPLDEQRVSRKAHGD